MTYRELTKAIAHGLPVLLTDIDYGGTVHVVPIGLRRTQRPRIWAVWYGPSMQDWPPTSICVKLNR
jgi:hypothetical protein